jgi:DUF1680 family protein
MKISRRRALKRQLLGSLAVMGWPVVQARNTVPDAVNPRPMRAALALKVSAPRADAAQLLEVSAVQLQGWLGERVRLNATRRLLSVDTVPLLAGFQHKPGSHPWIGEHVGKWMHAATLAWAASGDPALRAKLDAVARELIAAQEPDGYLGTYTSDKRFGLYEEADWDVWSHKYCLLGLLTYYRYTRQAAALKACEKAGDLLIATFPAKRSILAAGTHEGMAATSVLEPMVLLYRITGQARYLAFAHYIVKAWDEPKGPGIVASLLQGRPVNKVSNGKAYEMLSNLVGLAELARAAGEESYLQASLNAWRDIVDKRLFATGSTSQGEHFQTDGDMRDTVGLHIAETCVTTTWIQFNLVLLQMTGQARFGDELERAFYNHLAAAQHTDGDDWCYYTALNGRKQYDKDITCCHSSGPRGMALAPLAAYLRTSARQGAPDTLLVNTLETSSATLMLGGQQVSVQQTSGFPYKGESVLQLRMAKPAHFALRVRAPQWAQPIKLANVNPNATLNAGWLELPARTWKDGDRVDIGFSLASRVLSGVGTTNAGKAALAWGPFVLAFERQTIAGLPVSRALAAAPGLGVAPGASARLMPVSAGVRLRFDSVVEVPATDTAPLRTQAAQFVTFADAGSKGEPLLVWLRAPGAVLPAAKVSASLLALGEESRSRGGNGTGSVLDDDWQTLTNTYDATRSEQDWFAVTLDQPVRASRIVFTHGRNYYDGGWFDTEHGKPQVQIRRSAGGNWQTIGELASYPATTAALAPALADASVAHRFELKLPEPQEFVAVRVMGKPSSGERPKQSFVTCSELQAFAQ